MADIKLATEKEVADKLSYGGSITANKMCTKARAEEMGGGIDSYLNGKQVSFASNLLIPLDIVYVKSFFSIKWIFAPWILWSYKRWGICITKGTDTIGYNPTFPTDSFDFAATYPDGDVPDDVYNTYDTPPSTTIMLGSNFKFRYDYYYNDTAWSSSISSAEGVLPSSTYNSTTGSYDMVPITLYNNDMYSIYAYFGCFGDYPGDLNTEGRDSGKYKFGGLVETNMNHNTYYNPDSSSIPYEFTKFEGTDADGVTIEGSGDVNYLKEIQNDMYCVGTSTKGFLQGSNSVLEYKGGGSNLDVLSVTSTNVTPMSVSAMENLLNQYQNEIYFDRIYWYTIVVHSTTSHKNWNKITVSFDLNNLNHHLNTNLSDKVFLKDTSLRNCVFGWANKRLQFRGATRKSSTGNETYLKWAVTTSTNEPSLWHEYSEIRSNDGWNNVPIWEGTGGSGWSSKKVLHILYD